MKSDRRKPLNHPTVRARACLGVLVCFAGLWLTLCDGYAQTVPAVPKPTIAAVQCPHCKKWVDTPHGHAPASCPFCGYSFTRTSPHSSSASTSFPSLSDRTHSNLKSPQLQPINPFGDYLFYDVPLQPQDGQLKTTHFAPDGLPARAEEWGKQMHQLDDETRRKQEEQTRAFSNEKSDALRDAPGPKNDAAPKTTTPQLSNPFADDPSVVDLRRKVDNTPRLLQDSDTAQTPPAAQASTALVESRDLGAMIRDTDWPKSEAERPPDLTVGNVVANTVGGDAQQREFIQTVVDIGVDKTVIGVVSTTRDAVVFTGQVFDLGGKLSDAMTSGDIKDWKKVGEGTLAAGNTAIALAPAVAKPMGLGVPAELVSDTWQLTKWMVKPPPPEVGI